MISLLSMGQGNIKALKTTIESVQGVCDEIIYGDLLIFEDDRATVKEYEKLYNIKIIPFNFDFIFRMGFSPLLNILASHASNNYVLYLNTGEVIESGHEFIHAQMSDQYNAYSFDHAEDPHHWYRLYNRHDLGWSGLIHEQITGPDHRPCPFDLFRMADREKDMDNEFKARVFNDVKEICYFQNYLRLVECPELLGATNPGWINFAKEGYESFQDRLQKKDGRYNAFKEGSLAKYMTFVMNDPEFEFEKFESTLNIEFQGDPLYLGKNK